MTVKQFYEAFDFDTKSKTINTTRSDGRPDTARNAEWTQKGRLLTHEILTARGIQAVMDRMAA